jgi:hypothetical protein
LLSASNFPIMIDPAQMAWIAVSVSQWFAFPWVFYSTQLWNGVMLNGQPEFRCFDQRCKSEWSLLLFGACR